MIRTVVLVVLNVGLAVVLAVNLTAAAVVAAPVLRNEPIAGYVVLFVATVAFVLMNAALFRAWERRGRQK